MVEGKGGDGEGAVNGGDTGGDGDWKQGERIGSKGERERAV